jgi:Fic family protein
VSSKHRKVKLEQSDGDKMKELDRKLDTIMNRLETIERVLSDSLERPELASTISNLRAGVLLVKEPIRALERLSTATNYIHRRSVEKDEISRLIIQTLALNGPQNTSQIERAIREARGHASRRIIRSRIRNLISEGILRPAKGRGATYELTG